MDNGHDHGHMAHGEKEGGMEMHKIGHKGHAMGPSHAGHMQMIEDYKRRFFVCLALTMPIVVLSPTVQGFFGLSFGFPASEYLVFLLSSIVYFYGGYPFLKGFLEELKSRMPGMMTLVAVAINARLLKMPKSTPAH